MRDLSLAPIGDGQVLACYTESEKLGRLLYLPVPKWTILSLSLDRSSGCLATEKIEGPINPEGVYRMKLHRVGDTVVAYGGFAPRVEEGRYRSHPAWYMAVYSISTGEWETCPYVEGIVPPIFDTPASFSMGDTLVVAGTPPGEGLITLEGEYTSSTWEWSVYSRAWTEFSDEGQWWDNAVDCPEGFSKMFYNPLTRTTYREGVWEEKYPVWSPCPRDGRRYHVIGFPLGRNEIQLVTSEEDGGVYTAWLFDPVSMDLVPLQPLPLPEYNGFFSPARAVMVSPTTMLFLAKRVSLVVNIDPFMFSPECITSMEGCVFSANVADSDY
ncbi:hypothetical protein KIPB_000346 [Kipferlia bialata]|uniref:DUF4185 domain-containing protein n=1 Tax=Kipferlia bialata TaxID=797122 RepID=A0A391NRJ0_9EUKA|nr:hypothetical protein KIPB_000346 [Kipferlia bialata]|eukprot:g346.t1